MGNGLIGTVIQARMNSTRLAAKVLQPIAGRAMLGRVLDRHRMMKKGGRLIVATTDRADDDPIAEFCRGEAVDCIRGSESDVLDRYCRAAQAYQLDAVIRGTGDNPLVDPVLGDELVDFFYAQRADFASSKSDDVDSGLPDGVGLEVFAVSALEKSWVEGRQPHHREHINEYILENPGLFRIAILKKKTALAGMGGLRLTVDTPEDFERVERICHVLERAESPLILDNIARCARDLKMI
jgi:spore coat polysaccharide biosynthesis protein SpsF